MARQGWRFRRVGGPFALLTALLAVAGAAAALPDLAVVASNAPAESSTETVHTLTFTVENQGPDSAAASWTDTAYFSSDDVCCTGDTSLGSVSHTAALAAGAQYNGSRSVTLPGVPAGDYFLLVKTDSANQRTEEDEGNNVLATPVTLRVPDLAVTSLTAPAEGTAGTAITVSWQVVNQGEGTGNPVWEDHVFVTTDQTCCSGDVDLRKIDRTEALAPGANYTVSSTVTLPNRPQGDYFLALSADHASQLFEQGAGSNHRFTPLRLVTPDLVGVSFEVHSEGIAGEPVVFNWTVRNDGEGYADATWSDAFYLSTDDVCCTGDTLVGTLSRVLDVASGATYTAELADTWPGLPADNYTLFLRTDYGNGVYEGNETNNAISQPFRLRAADLVPLQLEAPAVASTQEFIRVDWTGRNEGDGTAVASWWDSLSIGSGTGCCPGNGQQRLGKLQHLANLSAGETYTQTGFPRIPQAVATTPGIYHLFVQLDKEQDFASMPNNVVEPGREGNNFRSVPIEVRIPDLVPANLLSPPSAKKGQTINISWTDRNDGNGRGVVDWTDRVSLLPTPTGIPTGVTATRTVTDPLDAGATVERNLTLTLPTTWPAGMYNLTVRLDVNTDLYEYGGTPPMAEPPNNVLSVPLALNLPDLRVIAGNAPGLARGDATFDVSWTALNDGSEKAVAPWKDAVYLSADAVLDAADARLGEAGHATNLTDGFSRDLTLEVTLPGVASGGYFLLVVADDRRNVTEGYEANNVGAVPLRVDADAPETTLTQAPTGLVASASATFAFEASEVATFACALDGGPAEACTSPRVYEGLADGGHTFEVTATDLAGNEDPTPATAAWTVDTTPPETTLLGGPAPLVNVTFATLPFEANEAASFACTLDGQALASCASPAELQDLPEGDHVFEVVATDLAGNPDLTPARRAWEVDTRPPVTSITGAPPAYTADRNATLSFTSDEEGSTFACALDGETLQPCTSPATYSGLAEGPHTFRVTATDRAGNTDPTPEASTFVVDTTPPVVAITRPEATLYLLDDEVLPTFVLGIAVGDLTVRAEATEDWSPLVGFRFFVDGAEVDPANVTFDPATGQARFTYRQPLVGLPNVTAEATNAAGLSGSDSVAFLAVDLPALPKELPTVAPGVAVATALDRAAAPRRD